MFKRILIHEHHLQPQFPYAAGIAGAGTQLRRQGLLLDPMPGDYGYALVTYHACFYHHQRWITIPVAMLVLTALATEFHPCCVQALGLKHFNRPGNIAWAVLSGVQFMRRCGIANCGTALTQGVRWRRPQN